MSEERIQNFELHHSTRHTRSSMVEHECAVALQDLLAENYFAPDGWQSGPYSMTASLIENRLQLTMQNPIGESRDAAFSMQPLKNIIRDYFMICEGYYEALKAISPAKVETLDMARRGVHNEGAEAVIELFEGKIALDFPTARRLFTLLCALQMK